MQVVRIHEKASVLAGVFDDCRAGFVMGARVCNRRWLRLRFLRLGGSAAANPVRRS